MVSSVCSAALRDIFRLQNDRGAGERARYSFTGFAAANFRVVVEKPQHCFALKITDFRQ